MSQQRAKDQWNTDRSWNRPQQAENLGLLLRFDAFGL